MNSAKFQFQLRTLMVAVVLAAVGSLYLAEHRRVADWQEAVHRGDTHVYADTNGDGQVDMLAMQLANGRREKMHLAR